MVDYLPPGVYTEEVPRGAASVVPVDTAVPAFVGYTERAMADDDSDLRLTPIRITSMLQFERHFGAPEPESTCSKHLLHHSLQLFFANGGTGANAFVVSVGRYKPASTKLEADELLAGLDALRDMDEPTLILVPEAQSLSLPDYATVMRAALDQCHDLQDRFVIMDLPGSIHTSPDAAVADLRAATLGPNLRYGAVYGPNLVTELHMSLPPSGAVAGVYATVDAGRGVWKAPANVALAGVVRPTVELTNAQQGAWNVDPVGGRSVNAIRLFEGRGTVVWGARTMAGNDHEWRYVNVHRLALFIRASVTKAMTQFTSAPNELATWARVRAMIENFLTILWREGALQGMKPEHAFYVAVGVGRMMTLSDIEAGRMIIDIGLATLRPAEFFLLRLTHQLDED